MDTIIVLLMAVVGFGAGVMVNALADAMPYYRHPRLPFYPPDGSARSVVAWSGLVAFLMGKRIDPEPAPPPAEGETDNSAESSTEAVVPVHRRLSWRHPVVEICMTVLFVFIALRWPRHERTVIWLIYLTILILITVIDIEHYLILFPVIVPGCLLAAIIAVAFPEDHRKTVDYFIGGALGGGAFLIMFWGGGVFSGLVAAARGEALDEVAFGFGDVLLAMLCGLMIGWQGFIFAMLITVFAGAVGAVLFLTVRLVARQGYTLFTPLPYGPYIVLGTAIMMLWREDIKALLGG
jgi:prepilin signal peptidase PulO-like enzyme (type II secretory pathway)